MTTSHPGKPALAVLGKRNLELGPFAIDEAPQESSPWANWRMRADADGVVWLLFDKTDSSANTLSAEVLTELDPATNNGSIAMAGALTVYLAYRRDEVHVDPAKLLVLAARAEWDGAPPEAVVEWLADRGLHV